MKRPKTAKPRPIPRDFAMPWGKGQIIEEAGFEGEWHEPTLQLMKYESGEHIEPYGQPVLTAFRRKIETHGLDVKIPGYADLTKRN